MHIIELRSDTFTRPTPAMRQAMADAEVGDDVWGEDPTVRCLEEKAAERLGKEAGLFVSSGTQGNLVSLLTHCGRGDEAIMGDESHTFRYEQGGCAALGGIMPHLVRNRPDGTIDLGELAAAIRPDDIHQPRTRLICLENTQNRCGGVPLTVEYTRQVGEFAHSRGLSLHIDGARLFNASVALGVDAKDLVAEADSVTFCLSKGLAAPVGSIICGTREFITQAHRNRKVLGGGMRQVGILAAAGLVALDEMVDRLADDHANAVALAEGLADLPGIEVEPVSARTDIVFFRILRPDMDAVSFCERLEPYGVRMADMGTRRVRAVTNYEVTREDIETALSAARAILTQEPAAVG
jgi:threonine aldolase